jgi:hypothetical protein
MEDLTMPLTKTLTEHDANEILKIGYPEKDMGRFPYGDLLNRLWASDPSYQIHGKRVMEAMNHLLSNTPGDVLGLSGDEITKTRLEKTRIAVRECFVQFDETTKLLFRLAALYHDIGKYIIKERHPTIGWYTMEYLKPADKAQLLGLLNERQDYLELLLVMVRDHDEFGVLCTGEASYPILLNATTSLSNLDADKRKIISSIMWLNLADIVGTLYDELTIGTVNDIIDDWKWYTDALDLCKKKEQTLEEYVIKESSSEDMVVKRISRLLIEASRPFPDRYNELTQPNPHGAYVNQLVRNQLRRVYTTHNLRQVFASEFAHVCKLDYGKRFFTRLIEYCEGTHNSSSPNAFGSYPSDRKKPETLIYNVFAILRCITSTYKAMIRSDNGVGNLIGVEMKDLTPENAKEKTTEICRLLVEEHYPGLSWMISDCPAWYF